MSVSDPIADALTVLRNASRTKKEVADIKASKILGEILRILKQERFIQDYRFVDDKKQGIFRIYLRYEQDNTPAIQGIKRISKPGRRHYVDTDNIPKVYSGIGIGILSTSKGILTDEEARQLDVGGEVLCYVW